MSHPYDYQSARLLERARRHLQMNDVDGAIALTSEIIARRPADIAARMVHARALLEANRPLAALHTLNASQWYAAGMCDSSLSMNNTEQLIFALEMRAEALSRLRRFDDAICVYRDILRHSDAHPEALVKLGSLLLESGEVNEAMALLEKLDHSLNTDTDYLELLASAYEEADFFEKAISVWERVDIPSDRELGYERMKRLIGLYRRVGRLRDASESYRRLIESDGNDDTDLMADAVEVAVQLGDQVWADKLVKQITALDPENTRAPILAARLEMASGRFLAAARIWNALKADDETASQALAGLIVCAISIGRFNLARRLRIRFNKQCSSKNRRRLMIDLWSTAMPGRVLYTRFCRETDETPSHALEVLLSEAESTLKRRSKSHPLHADVHYHIAKCQQASAHWDEAGASYDRALRINGKYVAAARGRIELLVDQANYSAARAMLQSAIANGVADIELMDLILIIELMDGDENSAVKALRRQELDVEVAEDIARGAALWLERQGLDGKSLLWRKACREQLGLYLTSPVGFAA